MRAPRGRNHGRSPVNGVPGTEQKFSEYSSASEAATEKPRASKLQFL